MTNAKNALATRRENGGQANATMAGYIRGMQSEFQLAMPRGAEATQLVRDGLTALRTTRNLDRAEPQSVLGALMTCAQLGLRPNVGALGHAWVLPFWNGKEKQHKAQLVVGYQGLVELAHRSPKVASLIARPVHEHDHFDVDYGIADSLVHKPHRGGDRGEVTDYYAIARYNNAGYAFWTMSKGEVERHRDRFATSRTKDGRIFGPWVDHFDPMALKTTIRMLAKYMPKGGELAAAIAVDGGVRIDLSPTADPADVTEQPQPDTEPADVVEGEVLDAEAPAPEVDESDWEKP